MRLLKFIKLSSNQIFPFPTSACVKRKKLKAVMTVIRIANGISEPENVLASMEEIGIAISVLKVPIRAEAVPAT